MDEKGTFDLSVARFDDGDCVAMARVASESSVATSPVMRGVWFGLGWAAVALGAVGIVVPGLPTTGFMVAAAACFARCSPRFEQWVLHLPGVGKAVGDYRAGLGMPRQAKVVALAMMTAAVMISAVVVDVTAVKIAIVIAGMVGFWFLVRRVPTAVDPG
jgi:uncharacterized membrane protein YbaN (DUF454 family)